MKNLKFVIHMEYFSPISGGTMALALLCHKLNSMGYKAYVTVPINYGGYITPVFDKEIQQDFINNNKNYFVIYPEQVFGNPFRANNVIRWILYTPDERKNHGTSYSDTDYIFKFSKYFSINPKYKTDGILFMTDIRHNMSKFKNYGLERSGSCFILKKGYGKKIVHDISDSVCIDNMTLEEKIEIFNRTKVFYSYDTSCFYSILCILCGCDSVIIPDEGVSRDEYVDKNPYSRYGIAYGIEDYEWSTKTKHLNIHNVMVCETNAETQIESMIKIIQNPRL